MSCLGKTELEEREMECCYLIVKDNIPAYEVQLSEEADCNEAIWCKLVTGHTTVTIVLSISLSQYNQTEQRKNT